MNSITNKIMPRIIFNSTYACSIALRPTNTFKPLNLKPLNLKPLNLKPLNLKLLNLKLNLNLNKPCLTINKR